MTYSYVTHLTKQVHVYIITAAERPQLYREQTEHLERLKKQNLDMCNFLARHCLGPNTQT